MRDHDPRHNERQERGRRRPRRPVLAAAALACLAVLTAACGSGGSTGSGTAAASPGGAAKGGSLAYSRCMRAHGIHDFPDPNSQGGINVNGGQGSDLDPSNPQFKAATSYLKAALERPRM